MRTLLDISREIQAISQSGLSFSKDPYDIERFEQLQNIASDLIARHTTHSKEYIDRVFSVEQGYATPKIDVRGAVFKDQKILLVKERESAGWTIPGGYVDINESLSTAVEREVREESGYAVKAKKVASIFDHRKHGYKKHLYHFYKIYMLCTLVGGIEKTSIETSEIDFFTEEQLDSLTLDAGRVTKDHIVRMFYHHREQNTPTDFD